MDWSQSKQAEQKRLLIFADRSDYRLCFFTSLFRWFVTGSGSRHLDSTITDFDKWMNPRLKKLKDPAAAVTSYVKRTLILIYRTPRTFRDRWTGWDVPANSDYLQNRLT
jgi:hypothetical protein